MSRGQHTQTAQVLEEIVLSAAKGEREAQDVLLRKYWPLIRAAVRGRKNRLGQKLRAREETQDLEQAAALKLLNELGKHEWRGPSAFAAWVRQLAEHGVIDAYRHHRAQKRDMANEATASHADFAREMLRSPESLVDDQKKLTLLLQDLERLKGEYAAALLMHHMGFAHGEIGETLGCSAEAARKLVSRSRTKLLSLRSAAEKAE